MNAFMKVNSFVCCLGSVVALGSLIVVPLYSAQAQESSTTTLPPVPREPENIISTTNEFVSVSLTWNPSPDGGIAGYKIYRGTTNGSYDYHQWVGSNTFTVTMTNVPKRETSYYAATAVGTNQMESDFSNEISYNPWTNAPSPPTLLPKVVVVPVFEVSTDGINWREAGSGPRVVFDAPRNWTESGFVRVRLKQNTVYATQE